MCGFFYTRSDRQLFLPNFAPALLHSEPNDERIATQQVLPQGTQSRYYSKKKMKLWDAYLK